MFTTELNRETLRLWADAAASRPETLHLAELAIRRRHPPPGNRHARGMAAATLARAARRLDGDAARRAIV